MELSLCFHPLKSALGVNILLNKRVTILIYSYRTYPYKLHVSLKLVKKHVAPQLQGHLSCAFQSYWRLLNYILVEPGWVYKPFGWTSYTGISIVFFQVEFRKSSFFRYWSQLLYFLGLLNQKSV